MSKIMNKKPCCNFCVDAGKPEDVCTSHRVKDLTGKIVCPTLLSTECRFCHKMGHTTKFCKELEIMNKARTAKPVAAKHVPNTSNKKQEKKPTSGFGALNLYSDNEEEDEESEYVAEPAPSLNGWAAIAAKPKSEPPKKSEFITLTARRNRVEVAVPKEPEPHPKPQPKPVAKYNTNISTKRWADISDSEEDEEDEYEEDNECAFNEDDTW